MHIPMLSGLSAPTNVEFAADGRVWVAEKDGIVKTFASIDDPNPTVAADLRAPVRSTGDHGLLGMAIDPQYPTRPYLYVLHTWDITGLWGDGCAAGYAQNGCVTGARLSRLTLDDDGVMVGQPQTIVDDRICYQFSSHGVGDLKFLDDGTLLASSGEGASWVGTDYGQYGGQQLFPPVANLTPRNPCGDPPVPVGSTQQPSTSEGGAFRSQDLLTDGDPLGWNGSLVRIDPDTGAAPADNPLVGDGNPDNDHVVAHGMRNPFRFTVRPGTNEVYLADVGQVDYEEINKVVVGAPTVPNFGWPCYEGPSPSQRYSTLNNTMCTTLINSPDAPSVRTDPWFAYPHAGGASIAGIAFFPPGRYPAEFDGNVLFADYVKGEMYALALNPDGSPSAAGARTVSSGGIPVEITAAPDGFLYFVDYFAGSVVRLVHRDSTPVARLSSSAIDGPLPLQVDFDASASSGPAGAELIYEWDLDGDGQFDDATGPTASHTYTTPTNTTVSVRVTIEGLASSTASTVVYPGNTAPEVAIEVSSPQPWSANDDIDFSITATDAEDGVLAANAVSWEAQIHHCYDPTDCHIHPYTGQSASLGGSITGPSHGFPSFLTISATATDSRGQSVTVTERLDPATVELQVTSSPPGAQVTVGETTAIAPFTLTVIRNDQLSVGVASPQTIDGVPHTFANWGHGAPRNHQYSVGGSDSAIHVVLNPNG